MSTIAEVLQPFIDAEERDIGVDWDALKAALMVRDDNMADFIRLAGTQFGTFPEFVAKVLMDCGLGTPPSEEMRRMIDANFLARMQWLREQYQQQNPDNN